MITCIILIGAPCSGKSTMGRKFATDNGYTYISSGDIARELASCDNAVKDDLNAGKLAPEYSMRLAIRNKIDYCMEHNQNIVLDGFPRFLGQAEWLQNVMSGAIVRYVLIHASLQTIIERSHDRNRSDDKSLEQRLDYYYNTTLPELSKYIDLKIDTDELSIDYCLNALKIFAKEVTQEWH